MTGGGLNVLSVGDRFDKTRPATRRDPVESRQSDTMFSRG